MEQKNQEELKVSIELKKRHDILSKKLDVAIKARNETNK